MTLKAQIAADITGFFDTEDFAEEITYTPSGGAPVTITVIIGEVDPSVMAEYPPADNAVLNVMVSDVADPQIGDTFTVNSETWHLISNLGGGSTIGTWQLAISRSARRIV